MPVEIIDASGKLLKLNIREMLKKADYERSSRWRKKRSPGREKSGR